MHAIAVPHRSRTARTLRLARALATLVAAGASVLAASATPALAGDCPNEQLRSENNSTRLPECRAYEMVTPLYKEGFPMINPTVSDEGAVAYLSTGAFDGDPLDLSNSQYVATRSSAGWTSTSLEPPATTFFTNGGAPDALSADLHLALFRARRLAPPADTGELYYLSSLDGSVTRIGSASVPGVIEEGGSTKGASADLSHIVFGHTTGSGSPSVAALWELVGTGNEGPPFPVSVDNNGQQMLTGGPQGLGEACLSGISADGRVIVFGCVSNGESELWARVGESATVAVAGSHCTRTTSDLGGACNGPSSATFGGMATDGSRVFFTTTQQLVNGDTDQSNDLYECSIPPGAPAPVGTANPCSSLTEVSHAASSAGVQNVVKVSGDGSHVYFIAKGVLGSNLGTNDAAPVAGDENLYVWEKDAAHPAGQTTFVTNLESGIGRPQTTVDGRYLLFSTASRLVASDTDEAPDIYRYDAQTRTMLRLSTDTSGTGGNEPGVEATLFFTGSAMGADGSTVVFDTAEALSPADTDGTTDVYEWHEGQVSLISNGGGQAIGITPSGRDIFIKTAQALTAPDSGIEEDFYDARVDGGFPVSAQAPCSGEACHGALAAQPPMPGPSGSATSSWPGSPLAAETPPSDAAKPKPPTAAQKLAKALRACRTKHHRTKRKACEKRARNTYRRAK